MIEMLVIVLLGGLLTITTMGLSLSIAQEITKNPGQEPSPDIPVDSDKYIIGNEDILSILVWKEEALSKTVVVRADGKISLPLIDEIKATGMTPLQLKEIVTEKLKSFVESPVVTVMVQQGRQTKPVKSYNVYITGQINKPGVYNLVGNVSILQFIAQVGGFAEWADQKKILFIRKAGEKESRFFVNYKKIISGEAPQLFLQPGDIIFVDD